MVKFIHFLFGLDNRFTPENIERAASCCNINDSNQAEAIEFLNEWSQNLSSLFTALFLIQNSNISISRFISSSLIKNKIPLFWNQIENDQKNEYRNSLFSIILNSTDINDNITYNLIDALCNIAIFDWPDEYNDFSEIFSPQSESNINVLMRLLSVFLKKVDTTNSITHIHRNTLRQVIITQFSEKIMLIIDNYINNLDLANDVLAIYSCMLKWESIRININFELFDQLINQFLLNENSCEITIELLRNIFFIRSDSKMLFGKFSPFLINLLSEGVFPSQQPITSNFSVIEFIIDFFQIYSYSFEIFLFYDQYKEENETLINNSIELLNQTIEENEIGPQALHDDIYNLCQIILSLPPEDIVENVLYSFISLWSDIIRRIRNENENDLPIKSASEIYLPFFAEIRQSLFNILSYIGDDDNDHQYYLESTISSIYFFNPDDFFDFLKEQSLSPQFCYALGAFELIDDMSKLENVVLIVSEVLQNLDTINNPEFHCSVLFGVSRCGRYFIHDHELFSQFIEFIFNSLSDSDKAVSNAASRSFKFLVDNYFDLFKFDYDFIVKSIVQQSEIFILNLEPKAAKSIFQACTFLINVNHEEEGIKIETDPETDENYSDSMFKKLFEPIITIISNIDQYQPEVIETSLEVISKSCHKKDDTSFLFNDLYDSSDSLLDFIFYTDSLSSESLHFLYSPLLELVNEIVPNNDYPNCLIDQVLTCVGIIESYFQFNEIIEDVNEIFDLMKKRSSIEDSFFKYFSLIRHSFSDFDSFYSELFDNLIIPYLNLNNNFPCLEMFNMISNFDPKVIDFAWVTEMTIDTIKDLDSNVISAAIKMYLNLIKKFNADECHSFLNDFSANLILIILDSIVNLKYNSLLTDLTEFLRTILLAPSLANLDKNDSNEVDSNLRKNIFDCLNDLVNEPEKGFFDNLVDYLFNSRDSKFEFNELFLNLLIVLKKYFPCDSLAFQNKKKMRLGFKKFI